jgi:hypothetical protein
MRMKDSDLNILDLRTFTGIGQRNMDSIDSVRTSTSYLARLERTLKALQDRVKEQEVALEKVELYNYKIRYPS